MASIDNPAIINWMNEEVRPVSEALERLKIKLNSANSRYTNEISDLLAIYASGDEEDSRRNEGAPILTKDDIITWMSNIQAVLATLDSAGRMDVLSFPAIRPPV